MRPPNATTDDLLDRPSAQADDPLADEARDTPSGGVPESVNPVRARRLALGLTQEQTADLANIPLATFKRWDRGEKRPRHAERAAALAIALNTTVEELWGASRHQAPEQDGPTPTTTTAPSPASSAPRRAPTALEVLQTLNDTGSRKTLRLKLAKARARVSTNGRVAAGVALALALIAIAVAAWTPGRTAAVQPPTDRQPRQASPEPTPTRASSMPIRTVELDAAIGRGNYDRAIAIATVARLDETAAALRQRAAGIIVRRAGIAADRGDLRLARSRLRRAHDRYGTAPDAASVRRRIRAVLRTRAQRAERRKRRAARARRKPNRAPSPAPSPVPARPTTKASGTTRPPSQVRGPAAPRATPAPTHPSRGGSRPATSAEREFGP